MRKLTIKIPEDRSKLYEVIHYPAGEIQVRLLEAGLRACRGKDAYEIVCNPIPDIIELAQLKDALDNVQNTKGAQFWHSSLFLPYMPYARADRRFVPGDSFGLLVWARLVNALGFDSIWTFDVHSDRADELFNAGISNILPTIPNCDQLKSIIKKIGRNGLVLVEPDEGAHGRYDLTQYDLLLVQGVKNRDAKTGKLSGFGIWSFHHGIVQEAQKALIVDDICDGGGTFIGLAEALRKINPTLELYLYVSHGIFSKGTSELLKHFKRIFISKYSYNPRAGQLIWPPLGVTQLGAQR